METRDCKIIADVVKLRYIFELDGGVSVKNQREERGRRIFDGDLCVQRMAKSVKKNLFVAFFVFFAACSGVEATLPDAPIESEAEPYVLGEAVEEAEILQSDIAGLTSWELVQSMGAGWNIGNTLDSHWNEASPWRTISHPHDQETLWGNPVTTREMIEFVRDSGFNTIRVPVTWYIHTGEGPEYIIDEAWMDRVQEIVDYSMDLGMFTILNIHHDDYRSSANWSNGWLKLYHAPEDRPLNDEEKAALNLRFARIWEQIAERFIDYNEYLIFEGINEPRTVGMYNHTNEVWHEKGTFLNELLQTFIDTVRASGGRNADRHLMVAPYFASVGMSANDAYGRIDAFVNAETGRLRVNDPRDRLIVSLHYYEPWGFVVAPEDSQWHSHYFDLDVGSVSWNIHTAFRIFEENFIARGIPIIMGETGAYSRLLPSGESNEAERVKWAEYFVGGLREMGIPTVIWDDGGTFGLLDRENLQWLYPDLAAALVAASQREIREEFLYE
ncbi:MAG: glycoside hydrolase family 5 protein [Defluviitaleaceae bacterium]|nr:glycoside hydrolase family 5 protein [Defluviitaleaceae bacterium]